MFPKLRLFGVKILRARYYTRQYWKCEGKYIIVLDDYAIIISFILRDTLMSKSIDAVHWMTGTEQKIVVALHLILYNIIEATILNGQFIGEDVLLPCILIILIHMPFEFVRLLFPMLFTFIMTTNTAQGL